MSLNKSKSLRTAEKYVLQGKIPAAIDEYRKVVSADPSDLTTINTLGDLYVRAGRIQDAISNFSRIADSYREGGFTLKAIAMLKKISKLDPTNVETAMKLANLYSQQGLLVEARQQYLQVADAYARAGQTRKALEAYQKIADLDPSNTSVRMKLGEIYSREAMTEQAHEAFIMAGAEFLRKGDGEQALNANLKAITINPDSRQALTAIATIYTQQGQTDRAINLLCEAFERNPGDVELLTILGRTYLSAGMMDEAERTFLSLVELDKNRYHYLLEVGRRFLQIGDLDRAAEQIDGCLEVLIAKREEDKAIDFLRRVLDKEANHIGALRRLAQIFLRIREDHNLIATLNSLVEAAMSKGNDPEAIAALKELARLEPDEPLHLQRLYNLGVQDIVEGDSPDVVRATGPLDFQSAAFDDTFVIRQISEAEILAGHGQMAHAVEILTAILVYTPENVQVHLKLKDIYLRAGIMDKAAQECLHLARIHEARGETARASDYTAEAYQLNPLIDPAPASSSADSGGWSNDQAMSFGDVVPETAGQSPSKVDGPGFEISDSSGLDWSRYQTGALSNSGFVTVPEQVEVSGPGAGNGSSVLPDGTADFRFSDTLMSDPSDREGAPAADRVFNSASLLASDTMPRVLRDELEGIDFYIAQGYVEIARDTLDRLRGENGDHPEILARYKLLGDSVESFVTEPAGLETSEPVMSKPPVPEVDVSLLLGSSSFLLEEVQEETSVPQLEVAVVPEEGTETPSYERIEAAFTEADEVESPDKPFLIQKESGPLYPDLLVQFNTSELHMPFDLPRPAVGPPPAEQRVGTGDLIGALVSGIDSSFDYIHQPIEEPSVESMVEAESSTGASLEYDFPHDEQETEAPPFAADQLAADQLAADQLAADQLAGDQLAADQLAADQLAADQSAADRLAAEQVETISASMEGRSARDELQEIFEELKEKTSDLKPLIDFETHYSLGLAYKDMDLLDEAISEFQMAFRTAGAVDLAGDCIHCCNMLGVCFKRKQIPTVAIMWFERGLKIPDRLEDEYQALRFEIGICYEEMGELD
ncbi:MAG TPA: tetratricopeptide repeat protein, partial [Blastocatellia bacterium]|nr:tetratricopeptide repeat protein [Blastocatellia bacterium]